MTYPLIRKTFVRYTGGWPHQPLSTNPCEAGQMRTLSNGASAQKSRIRRSLQKTLTRIEGELKWYESLAAECEAHTYLDFSRGRACGIRELVHDVRNIIAGLR